MRRSILLTTRVIATSCANACRMMASVFDITYTHRSRSLDSSRIYGKIGLLTPSTTSTTSTIPSTSRMAEATSSTKFTCPGVSIKLNRWDFPAEDCRTKLIGDDFSEMSRDMASGWVSVYRSYEKSLALVQTDYQSVSILFTCLSESHGST